MTILLLEDTDSGLEYLSKVVKAFGYNVIPCVRIDMAKKHLESRLDDIDCIVADLSMNPEWLDPYGDEAEGGLLSGWVFLYRFVYPKRDIPTVIYSGYIEELNERLSRNKDEFEAYTKARVKCVPKGGSGDRDICRAIEAAIRGEKNEKK